MHLQDGSTYNSQFEARKHSSQIMPEAESIRSSEKKRQDEAINTEMVTREATSNRKAGTKFDIIKTVNSLRKAQEPGSHVHYEHLLN